VEEGVFPVFGRVVAHDRPEDFHFPCKALHSGRRRWGLLRAGVLELSLEEVEAGVATVASGVHSLVFFRCARLMCSQKRSLSAELEESQVVLGAHVAQEVRSAREI